MRFLGYKLQFWTLIFTFCAASFILPSFCVSVFSWIANSLLCFSAALWILESVQDFFFRAKIDQSNKAVLITGCDSGFGNAIAKILHGRGYTVFACCYDKMSDGAVSLEESCSSRLKIIQMDVTKDESVEEAVNYVKRNLGKSELWAVVNNAGVLKGFQTELCSMKDYEDCIQVNVLGVVRVTKAFLPLLRQSRGRVVNICSLSGRFCCPFLGAYTTSKAAAIVFTEILRQEMREFGVRAISIEPEFFKTPMCSEKYVQSVLEQSLSEVKEEIKTAYGASYIEKAKEIYLKIFLNRSQDVQLVFNAVEAAVSLKNPADVYKPCRNFIARMLFMLGERVAVVFNDLALMIVLYVMGLPPPHTGLDISSRVLKM